MQVSEDQITRWSQPPSQTEDQKCLNAISQITDALRLHFGNDIAIIRQGSHTNRTHIKLDSDVDLAVVHTGYYFPDLSFLSASDKALYQRNRQPADYLFSQFKNDVCTLLKREFGISEVERKNKCIKVRGNSNRISADVVPAYEHRRFSSYGVLSAKGIEFVKDDGNRVFSFPEQHYSNGVKKNDETGRSFKSVIRILKNVRNKFVDNGSITLESMPSFFVECLIWNLPNSYFRGTTWREISSSVALKIWSDMRTAEIAKDYAEVSDLMWLFRGSTTRTYKQAEDFILNAWSYLTT